MFDGLFEWGEGITLSDFHLDKICKIVAYKAASPPFVWNRIMLSASPHYESFAPCQPDRDSS